MFRHPAGAQEKIREQHEIAPHPRAAAGGRPLEEAELVHVLEPLQAPLGDEKLVNGPEAPRENGEHRRAQRDEGTLRRRPLR